MDNKWILADCPAERVYNYSAQGVTNRELIATIIGGNDHLNMVIAGLILVYVENNLGKLSTLSLEELNSVAGVTRIKAAKIAAAFELVRRKNIQDQPTILKVTKAADIFEHIKLYLNNHNEVESFGAIYLNRSYKVLSTDILSSGGITGTVADPRVIIHKALLLRAVTIILFHNHPSGNLKPSRPDEELTLKIKQACELFDIRLADHIIISSEGYFSFAESGLI